MSYTTNLELRVIDNSDNFTDVFTQGNYNANKLEEKMGSLLDDLQALPQVVEDITTLQGNVSDLDATITGVGHRVDDLVDEDIVINNKITAIENGSVKLNVGGEIITGTVARYVINATATGFVDSIIIGDNKLTLKKGSINLNATTLFNITNPSAIKILNYAVYDNNIETGTNADVDTRFIFNGFQVNPITFNYLMEFGAENVYITPAQSSVAGTYEGKEYVIVIDLFRPDVE